MRERGDGLYNERENKSQAYAAKGEFIHLFIQIISIAPLQVHYYSEALPTQHGYCARVSRRSATGNCKLRTCPRSLCAMAARTGFEPTTLRLKGIDSTNAPPRPTIYKPFNIGIQSLISHE